MESHVYEFLEANANKDATNGFVTDLLSSVHQKIFNCDRPGLFCQKMPNRVYITQQKKAQANEIWSPPVVIQVGIAKEQH